MKQTYLAYSIVVATIIAALVGLFFIYMYAPSVSGSSIPPGVACNTHSNNVTIIADQSGFNDSVNHGVPKKYWPVICVKEGSYVTIVVKNLDSVQPHGFAIRHYFDAGVAVMPNKDFKISFVANQKGAFLIQCDVLCTVHWAMLSGLLVVQ